MPFRKFALAVALALAAAPAAAQGEPPSLAFALHLDCRGAVSQPAGLVAAGDPLLVDIDGDRGRVRVPHVMRQFGGDEGWRPMHDIRLDEHLITGRFWLTPWNRPSVVIDRVSGRIVLAGFRGFAFHGDCAPYDAGAEQRF